jgi:AsmA protein
LGIALLVIVVLLVGAALITPYLVDVNKYHDQIQTQLQKKLGRPVSLGRMSLSLFPPSFQVENAVIGEDKNFNTGRSFATAEKLAVSIKLLPLLSKELEVNSLELRRPYIELVRNAQGEWNFATLGEEGKPSGKIPEPPPQTAPGPQKAPGQQTAPGPQAPQPSSKPAGQFELSNLQITDGQVAITDFQKHQSRAVYDHIDLSVSDFAPNQEFTIKAAAHLPGQGKQEILLDGKGGPIKQADLLNTNFNGNLSMEQVSVDALQKFLNSAALNGIDAQISGSTKVQNSGGKIASSGDLRLENTEIHNVKVGYPIAFNYDVSDDLSSDVIQIHRGQIKLGSTPLSIAGTLDSKPTPAQIDLKLTASNASIAEAARLASAFGVAFNQGMDVNGKIDADIQAKGAVSKPALNGHLSANELVISGRELPQPVKVGAVNLTLTPDTIRSNDFTASTGSTNVTINLALAHYTSPDSVIDATLRAPNARIGELLNMAKAYGVSAVEGMSGDGTLSLDVRAQGPIKDSSALNFNGSGKIQNATLKMPSLTKPVQIRNSDIKFSQNSAALDNVVASIGETNANGALTIKNFAAPQVQFTLNADKLNVTELQQIYVASPSTPKRAQAGRDFWSVVPTASAEPANTPEPSMLSKMTGGGTINVGTVQQDNLVMNNLHSNVSLNHGLIQLNPVTADLYGGKENGNISIDTRPAQPVYNVNLKTDKVDANKLISSVSSVKQVLYGILTSNVNASFSSTSAEAIARGLNGNVALNLANGKLMNVDLLHELASVGKFLGGLPGAPKNFTDLMQLSGNFDIKNGIAQTNNLKAVIDGGTLAAAGLVNLADQSLNMHLTAVLGKALSQQVGGSQIGGFMNTALANNQGELVLPVIVTGSFQHPQIAPDVQQIAQMKLKNLLPTSKDPGALTSGILGAIMGNNQPGNNNDGGIKGIVGAITGKQQQQQQDQQQQSLPQSDQTNNNPNQKQQQENPLGGILNQVLKNKKQQQQPPPKN